MIAIPPENTPTPDGPEDDSSFSLAIRYKLSLNQAKFLAAYSETGGIKSAAKLIGLNRRCHSTWSNKSEDYRKAFAEANKDVLIAAEDEIKRRGIDGWDEPVFQQGKKVGIKRRYSDTLLLAYANAHIDGYGRSTVEHSGQVNQNVTITLEQRTAFLEAQISQELEGRQRIAGNSSES